MVHMIIMGSTRWEPSYTTHYLQSHVGLLGTQALVLCGTTGHPAFSPCGTAGHPTFGLVWHYWAPNLQSVWHCWASDLWFCVALLDTRPSVSYGTAGYLTFTLMWHCWAPNLQFGVALLGTQPSVSCGTAGHPNSWSVASHTQSFGFPLAPLTVSTHSMPY